MICPGVFPDNLAERSLRTDFFFSLGVFSAWSSSSSLCSWTPWCLRWLHCLRWCLRWLHLWRRWLSSRLPRSRTTLDVHRLLQPGAPLNNKNTDLDLQGNELPLASRRQAVAAWLRRRPPHPRLRPCLRRQGENVGIAQR